MRDTSSPAILQTLRPGHPRLLAMPEDIARVHQSIRDDATAQALYESLRQRGARMLDQPPVERILSGRDPGYMTMLAQSRAALDRIYTLAFLYRVEGDPKWAARAIQEMLAIAAFPDWNPAHWLDVAEMMHALAIGYDWLYDVLAPEQRATIKTAIVEKGLREADKAYAADAWWVHDRFNWNLVCNGAIIVAALSVADQEMIDEEPQLASRLVAQALDNLPHALQSFAPDGAWAEGPGYWGYAMRYTSVALAALESALGDDFGLGDSSGLAEAGLFRLYSVGPTGLFFNFADAGEQASFEPALFWLASRYDNALLAHGAQRSLAMIGGEDTFGAAARGLLWLDPRHLATGSGGPPLDAHYRGAHVAFLRSSWSDPDAISIGFKGGDNKANHAHLDLGTFVLDALGQRWAIDLGSDDYTLPGYWGAQRWSYYRLQTAGHNTLTLDGHNQDAGAVAPIINFHSYSSSAYALADLTAAYLHVGATLVQRAVALTNGRAVVMVQDNIEADHPLDIVWAMHTRAAITIDHDRAWLSHGGRSLEAFILGPSGARFAVEEVELAPPQRALAGVRKLLVRLPAPTASTQIRVMLAPQR